MIIPFNLSERLLQRRAAGASTDRSSVASLGVICRYLSGQLHALAMILFACFEAIAIALGLMVYATDPFGFVHPRIAWVSLSVMALIAVAARTLRPLRKHVWGTRSVEVGALFLYAALMTFSMGAANSPFIALYAITLLAAALVWDVWAVMVLAAITFVFTFFQTDYLDLMDEMPLYALAVVILNALLPAAAAASMIATVRRLFSAVHAVDSGSDGGREEWLQRR